MPSDLRAAMLDDDLLHHRVAEILAVLMATPDLDRLDVLAVAVKAAIEGGVV